MVAKAIGYWVATAFLALELVAGGIADLIHGKEVILVGAEVNEILWHLGYPTYLLAILGVWKLLGAAAILAPRFPRLKEWAYAGAFFEMSGAFVSHLFRGDGPSDCAAPLVFTLITLVSWALRPQSRMLGSFSLGKTTA